MSSNKKVRENLIKKYGNKCMLHEGLKITGYKKCKCNYKGKKILMQLTLHHLTPLKDNRKNNYGKWSSIM